MMHPRHVFVDLPKDRRPEVYRFRSPRGEAKGGGGAFHLLGKSKLCSRKNAHRRCRILRRSKPSSIRVKVDGPKLVTDLGRPRSDVVETEVTHGRGTPLTSRSPRPFFLPEPAQNSNRARHCEPLRGGDKPADLPVQQPTKFSASVVCSGTIGRSTLSVLAAGPDRGYGNADATVVLILLHGARLQSRLVLCPLFGDAQQVKYVALEPLGATEGASHDVAYHSRQAEAGNVGFV